MKVEVAYAEPEVQSLISLEINEGATALDAIVRSGILQRFPNLDPAIHSLGIFGKLCKPDQPIKDGDRIEIYRPLIADPKEARRHRAAGSDPKPPRVSDRY